MRSSTHARHAALNAAVTYAGMGSSVLSAPVLAHTLGADGRGVLAGTFVVLQVAGWIAFLGLPSALSLQVSKRQELAAWGVVATGLIGLGVAAVVAMAAPTLANGDERIALGMRVVAVLLVFTGLGNIGDQVALLRGAVVVYNVMRAATLVLPSVAILVLAALGHLTVLSAFVATLAGQSITVLLGCAYALRNLRGLKRARVPWSLSLKLWITTVFDSVGGRGDQVALTMLSSAPVVGVYAIAVTCATAASGVANGLAQASFAQFVRSDGAEDELPIRRLMAMVAVSTAVVGSAILAVVALFGDRIFGDDFSGLPPVVAVLLVAGVLQDMWRVRAVRESVREQAGSLAVASAVGLVAMIALIAVLAARDSVNAVSMAMAFMTMCAVRLGTHLGLMRMKRRPHIPVPTG
ncbi:oligosaccharide flippase family protein [Nocardioides zeae]